MIKIFQKGFHFSQDGPGNRLIYHLQGCNLRCPWCSNPEGLSVTGGKSYSVEELLDEIIRSSPMYFDGGGVTFTGGEVTVQIEELTVLMKKIKENGINTCIETNGISKKLKDIYPYLDYLIIDVKHYNPNIHKKVTGLSNELTIENVKSAIKSKVNTLIRIPLIGGFNDSIEDAEEFSKLFNSIGFNGFGSVEILTYHDYGKVKYEKLDLEYKMDESAFVSRERFDLFCKVLTDNGIKLIKT